MSKKIETRIDELEKVEPNNATVLLIGKDQELKPEDVGPNVELILRWTPHKPEPKMDENNIPKGIE